MKSFIRKLRSANPERRPALISALYERNRRFFREKHPHIDRFLHTVDCPYHINITEQFLDIVHTPSGILCHPEQGLDIFSEALGAGGHQGWIDLVNAERSEPVNSPGHVALLHSFQNHLETSFPDLAAQLASGRAIVKTSGAGGNFSPPVVFAGIFHGLHVEHFLANTDVTRIVLSEPEPERFEVSCYFIDYEQVSRRFGVLPLSIGQNIDRQVLNWFHSNDKITSRLWLRVLPGYVSERIAPVVRQIAMQQRTLDGMTTSLDNEINGLTAGWRALQERRAFLTGSPALGDGARIAIIASGPSLKHEYQWLRENRERLILFAVHSSVLPLKQQGIVPDFQFSIDMHLNESMMSQLSLHREVPLIAYFKASPATLASVAYPLLVAERDAANPVRFTKALANTHPSTATLALSFACCCNPAELYLVGLDLGFVSDENQAISGGIHDQRPREYANIHPVRANFSERGEVLTTPFYNTVRMVIEKELAVHRSGRHCVNLSDGAHITGAEAVCSGDLKLGEYPEKSCDIAAIRSAFQAAEENKNWQQYEISGRAVLAIFNESLDASTSLKRWNWPLFSDRLDNALKNALRDGQQASACLRMTIYERLIVDVLSSWYRYLLLADDPERAGHIYERGRAAMAEVLDHLEWPLDENVQTDRPSGGISTGCND